MAAERAMVSASTGAMNSVLSKLATLRKEENRREMSRVMRKQVVLLMDELKSMKGLLEKVADREDHDALVKGWMSQVREMTYDLEDFIDQFMHKASPLGGAKSGVLRRASQMLGRLKQRRYLELNFEEIRLRVFEASERRLRYKLDDAATSSLPTVPVDPRLPSLYIRNQDSLVGIDRPREELIAIMKDDCKQLQVVAIVGFGGIGKTTLAATVYEMLQMQFDCSAFVTVSQKPDMNKVLRDMLHQVKGRPQGYSASMEAFGLQHLIDALIESLTWKRYLVVIDDLWSKEAWNILRYAFWDNNIGSKVLVTTRIQDVAMSCCNYQSGAIYQMRPLSESESRSLLFRRAFNSETEKSCPLELSAVSNDILKKCGGIPLSIITLGSMLATRSNVLEAREIITDLETFKHRSLQSMRHILDLSYVSLPFHLKTCLLYLSMFPEDYVIERKRLVRRWMAEGFISGEHGLNLEEVGDSYFNELINTSLIQPVDIQYDGRVNTCRVHDTVLDLIIHRSSEENFVICGRHGHELGLQDKVRRLSLDCDSEWDTFTPSETTTAHVRSLTIIGSNGQMPRLANFCVLRVLDLENYGELESTYLQSIGKLYLLKYLRLKTPSVIKLPEEMGKLENLETLDLTGAPKSELPKSIIQLNKLIYFLVYKMKLPGGFSNMLSLKEVSCIEIDSNNCKISLKELANLTMLTALGLNLCISGEDTEMKDTLVSFLRQFIKSNIQSLDIECADCCSLDFLLNFHSDPCYHLREIQIKSNNFFHTVPKWMPSVFNLTLLRVNIEIVGEEVLQILGGLKSLEALILMVKSTASEGLIISSNGFQCLKQFDLTYWNSLGVLKFEPGAMKILQKLRVVFSAQGECVGNGFLDSIEHLTSLKHLVIELKYDDVSEQEVKAAADAIRDAAGNHTNRPRVEVKTHAQEKTVGDVREIPVHGEDEKDQNVEEDVVVEAESTPATES